MSNSKLLWDERGQRAKAAFTIEHVGRVNIEVESDFPGAGPKNSPEEKHALALRHAKLLVRNLASALERQLH